MVRVRCGTKAPEACRRRLQCKKKMGFQKFPANPKTDRRSQSMRFNHKDAISDEILIDFRTARALETDSMDDYSRASMRNVVSRQMYHVCSFARSHPFPNQPGQLPEAFRKRPQQGLYRRHTVPNHMEHNYWNLPQEALVKSSADSQ